MKNIIIKRFLLLSLISIVGISVFGQPRGDVFFNPRFAVKTNILYGATTTINAGFEFALSKKITLDMSGNYNPWTFSNNKKLKHWLIQPELRYWLCDRFSGHFFGMHVHYAEFNVAGIKMLGLENYRHQGNLYGAGISYGYHWILGPRWSIEGVIGLGYAHLNYDKYLRFKCGKFLNDDHKNYWGPTKVSINLIYILR